MLNALDWLKNNRKVLSSEGVCEESNAPAGQGGKHRQQLSVTHVERSGGAKEGWGS